MPGVSHPALPHEEPGCDPIAVDDGDLDATLLQEPGGRETDHAGADDGDALGDGKTRGGDGCHVSIVTHAGVDPMVPRYQHSADALVSAAQER